MAAKLRVGFNEVFADLKRRGLLLVHDNSFPSLTKLTIGEPIRGSWWAHPLSNDVYMVGQQLHHQGDVVKCKLVSGKETYVHRSLWPCLAAIGMAREPWQLESLTGSARAMLGEVDRQGRIRIDEMKSSRSARELGDDARALQARLLVFGDDVHTDTGAHVKRIESWPSFAERVRFPLNELPSPASARAELERIVTAANRECSASAMLPWQKLPRPSKR